MKDKADSFIKQVLTSFKTRNMKYYVYIVSCSDGTYYTGYARDLRRRMDQHNGLALASMGAKYTRSRRPVSLEYVEGFSTRSEAMKREAEIKKLSHGQKKDLVESISKENILLSM